MGRGRRSDEQALPPLLPRPRRAERRPGRLALRDGLPIVLEPNSDDRDFAAACALRDAVAAAAGVRLGVGTPPRSAGRRPGRPAPRAGVPLGLEPNSADRAFAAACALRDAVAAAAGVRLCVETHARSDDLGPRIALRREADAGEAYRLRVAPDA